MAKSCNYQENKLSVLLFFIFTITGTEGLIGIIVNGFILAVNAAEVRNKEVPTSGKILFFPSISRIALQSIMMIGITLSSVFPCFYNQDVVYGTLKLSYIVLNYYNLSFAAWFSFFCLVKFAGFSNPFFLKLKWRISRWMPWLLWLSVFTSMGYSVLFIKGIFTVCCSNPFSIPSSNSTEKKYFAMTNMVSLVLLYDLGIFLSLFMFTLAASLLIASLERHALHMESNAWGSRDSSMQAHMGAIKAISYFLLLYIFNAVATFLHMPNIFDTNSPWNILCRVIMEAYLSGHSVLLILDNPGLKRACKQLQHRVHFYLEGQPL
ncbi:LOW QUALITY PROTEIN: taste receptor type 2 member 39-like [Dugong dugon]